MGVKKYVARKVLERQIKGMPESQRVLFLKMFDKNPELFEAIARDIKDKKDQGQDETLATTAVLKKYQSDLQKAMAEVQSNT